MAISTIQDMTRTVQSNLASALQDSNDNLTSNSRPMPAPRSSFPFDNEDMMDELMNQIGLRVQRDGG